MTRYVRPGVAALCTAIAFTLSAPRAGAQVAAAPAAPPSSVYRPIRIGGVTIAGSVRVRGEDWNWFESSTADASYTFGHALVRLGATYASPRLDVMVEASQPTILGAPANAVATGAAGQLGMGATYRVANGEDRAGAFLKQAFVRFKNVGAKGNMARLGRIEFIDGAEAVPADSTVAWLKRERIAHRLLANFAFSAAQRSYDAIHLARSTPKYNVTLMAGMPTEGVFQLDGQGTLSDIRVGYGAVTVPFSWADVRLFGLRYEDRRPIAKVDNRPAAVRTTDRSAVKVNTLGANVVLAHPVGSAKTDLLLWGAVQNGDWGAQEHTGSAFAVEGGVQPALPLKPWLRVGFSQGSGDDTPGTTAGGEHTTFFQMLPTPRIYARTPFYNMMNNRDLFSSLILRPAKGTTVRAEVHKLSLTESSDLWYAGGGAYSKTVFGYQGRPSGGQSNLATLADIGADRAFGPLLNVGAYFGMVFGGDVVRALHPAGEDGKFLYLELTRRF
ncbi:MAG TPA: alginate export family protein [Gemmatimonadaceae bacterium]|nr:alginate export family protein [Gemmatimonadaceae bacterium]